jgi:FixJ family two-component response regulator
LRHIKDGFSPAWFPVGMTLAASGVALGSQPEADNVILLVDDDPAVRSSLKFSLEIEGYTVRVFATGRGLLAEGKLPLRGCVIADYKLPDTNGLDLIRGLRGRGVKLPAILITSDPGPLLRARADRDGVPIVEKPLLGNALMDAVRSAIGA